MTLSLILSGSLSFAALAVGGHDLWSATIVYVVATIAAAAAFRQSIPIRFVVPALLVFVAWFISFFHSVNPSESWMGLMDWASAFLFFLIALSAFRESRNVRLLHRIMVIVVCIQWGFVVYEALHRGTLRLKDMQGTMNNANIQTAFFLIWIPSFIKEALDDRRNAWFWIVGATASVTGICVLSSTAGVLGAGLGVLLSFASAERFRSKTTLKAGAAAIAVLGLIGMVLLYQKLTAPVLIDYVDGRSYSDVSARFLWWKTALNMWRDHPWCGVGIGNFPSAFLAYKVGASESTLYAHGFFFELLSEVGLVGLAALLLFIGTCASNVHRTGSWNTVRWHPLIGISIFLAFSSISVSLEYLANLMALAIVFGSALAPAAGSFPTPRPLTKFILAALALSAFPYLVSPFLASRNTVASEMERRQGNIEESRRLAKSATELDPRSWEAERQRSVALTSGNQPDLQQAIVHAERAVSLNRLSGLLHWELAHLYLRMDRKDEAIAAFEKAHLLNRNHPRYLADLNANKKEFQGPPLPR